MNADVVKRPVFKVFNVAQCQLQRSLERISHFLMAAGYARLTSYCLPVLQDSDARSRSCCTHGTLHKAEDMHVEKRVGMQRTEAGAVYPTQDILLLDFFLHHPGTTSPGAA